MQKKRNGTTWLWVGNSGSTTTSCVRVGTSATSCSVGSGWLGREIAVVVTILAVAESSTHGQRRVGVMGGRHQQRWTRQRVAAPTVSAMASCGQRRRQRSFLRFASPHLLSVSSNDRGGSRAAFDGRGWGSRGLSSGGGGRMREGWMGEKEMREVRESGLRGRLIGFCF